LRPDLPTNFAGNRSFDPPVGIAISRSGSPELNCRPARPESYYYSSVYFQATQIVNLAEVESRRKPRITRMAADIHDVGQLALSARICVIRGSQFFLGAAPPLG
jgi:hypothetical protein